MISGARPAAAVAHAHLAGVEEAQGREVHHNHILLPRGHGLLNDDAGHGPGVTPLPVDVGQRVALPVLAVAGALHGQEALRAGAARRVLLGVGRRQGGGAHGGRPRGSAGTPSWAASTACCSYLFLGTVVQHPLLAVHSVWDLQARAAPRVRASGLSTMQCAFAATAQERVPRCPQPGRRVTPQSITL